MDLRYHLWSRAAVGLFSDRFEREAQSIAALNHPNICTLHDVGPNYLIMELVEGPTLADQIKEGPLPLDESLAIASQIAGPIRAVGGQWRAGLLPVVSRGCRRRPD